MTSFYDQWKTSPPEPSRAACASCGEQAYDVHDNDDQAWGWSTGGDYPVCDALCGAMDALNNGTKAQRVAAVKLALWEDAELPMLEFLVAHGPESKTTTTIIGTASYDGDTMLVSDNKDVEHVVPWNCIRDVKRPAAEL
jgi:hypothetical protein